MSAWNLPARMLAVPLSTAVASCMFFVIPVMSSSGTSVHGALPVLGIFLIIGAIIGLIVGCPLVLLVDGIFPQMAPQVHCFWRGRGFGGLAGPGGCVRARRLGSNMVQSEVLGGLGTQATHPLLAHRRNERPSLHRVCPVH